MSDDSHNTACTTPCFSCYRRTPYAWIIVQCAAAVTLRCATFGTAGCGNGIHQRSTPLAGLRKTAENKLRRLDLCASRQGGAESHAIGCWAQGKQLTSVSLLNDLELYAPRCMDL